MKNINFMMNMVNEFLSGKMSRLDFELDFNHELKARYNKMCREHQEYAEVFYDWLSEDGVDKSDGLSDKAFKRLIREQYNEVKSIAAEGFC
jgi:hypothetical protein